MCIPDRLIRGVENTEQAPPLESLIDWCAFTIPDKKVLEEVLSLMGIPLPVFVQLPKGRLGYRTQKRHGHIVILSDGMPEMGIHVEMSGQGCRQFDASSGRWRDLISKVHGVGGHFARLDVAIDDRHGYFLLTEAKEKLLRREVRTRFRSGREMTGVRFSDKTGNDGCTLYFGTSKSDLKIRIYDKAAEQRIDGPWIRTEIECHRKHANNLAHHISAGKDQCFIVAGILKNYVAFVEPSDDLNKSRWKISPWWENFLGTVEKLSLASKRNVEINVQDIEAFLNRQAAPYIALLVKANGGDLSCVDKLIDNGEKRLKPHHYAMLNKLISMETRSSFCYKSE